MDRFTGLIGIVVILGIAFLFSNNKRKINYRLVASGIGLQILLAVLILKVGPVKDFFQFMGQGMQQIEHFAKEGANFVYGGIAGSQGGLPRGAAGDSTLSMKILVENGVQKEDAAKTLLTVQRNMRDVKKMADSTALANRGVQVATVADASKPFGDRLSAIGAIVPDSAMMAQVFGPEAVPSASILIANQARYVEPVADFRTPTSFVFAFNITATIILVCALVAIMYHFKIMQMLVSVVSKAMNFVMRVSGAEALSNVASAFVGQIEAQVMIQPYLKGMTKSELLASMTGSLACIAGGILIVYVSFGAKAEYLLTASMMAAPGALVISKIIFPETEVSETMGNVKLEVKSPYTNMIDAIAHGATDGFKISMNVLALLLAFIALVSMVNALLGLIPHDWAGSAITLDWIFSWLFRPIAWCMGIPTADVSNAATLFGQKLTINEFIAFKNMTGGIVSITTPKGEMITSIAICGFANFSSVGMQIGGIGALAPERRADLARLGLKALLGGTLASYLSATIAGILF
jgi:concentrative nucleoside transporter, CNT family